MAGVDTQGDVVAGDGVGGFVRQGKVKGLSVLTAWDVPHALAAAGCLLLE